MILDFYVLIIYDFLYILLTIHLKLLTILIYIMYVIFFTVLLLYLHKHLMYIDELVYIFIINIMEILNLSQLNPSFIINL